MMTHSWKKILILAVLATLSQACGNSGSRGSTVKEPSPLSSASPAGGNQAASSPTPSINPAGYNQVRSKIDKARVVLSSRYQQATTSTNRVGVIDEARAYLTQSVYNEVFPFWYGTGWDFNGTTETPGQGKIACGYFVSTVLRDAGLKVQRAKMAQQASENIILSLTTDPHIKRFRNVPISDFVQAVQQWGPGLYVVGLDIHTGFILNVDGDVYFIHSSYVDPYSVVKERALDSKILASSRYRVLGKLTADDALILKWLTGDPVITRTG